MQRHGHRMLVYLSLLVAQGVVISIFERMLPSPFVFAPGAKLGLANIVTLLALFTLTPRQSFQVVSLRLLVTLLVGGTFSMFFYSLVGSYLSFGAMLLVKQLGPKRVSVIGLSIMGGMLFNVGQLSVAAWFARSWTLFNYLPWLSLAGCLAGLAVGVLGYYLLENNHTLQYYQQVSQQETWF